MMKRIGVWYWISLLALFVTACGGGGGGFVPHLNGAPIARVAPLPSGTVAAGTVLPLDGSASSDPDGNALTFAWSIISAPPDSATAIVDPSNPRTSFTPDVAGSYTFSLTVSDGQATSAPASITVAVTTITEIAINIAEPLSGVVELSLKKPGANAGPVNWYIDQLPIGPGRIDPAVTIQWNTRQTTNGAHEILARIQRPNGSTTDIRRTVLVSNGTVGLSVSARGTSGIIVVDIDASSTFGIAEVSLTMDGTSAGVLTTPNACSSRCGPSNDIYRYNFDSARLGSGIHTAAITAIDSAGNGRQLTLFVPVSNAPAIALATPIDGALVNGSLRIDGTVTSDKSAAGAIAVTATLGSLEALRGTGPSFASSFDLSGVEPGSYTLTIKATDVDGLSSETSRTVVVTSSPSLSHQPLFTLAPGGQLLAAEGSNLLYASADGTVALRDVDRATEVVLSSAARLQSVSHWQLSGGRVYAQGKGSDCNATPLCIYMWQSDGAISNLTLADPYASGYQENPVAKGDAVVWSNNSAGYTLYQATARSYTQVMLPAGSDNTGNNQFDLVIANGLSQLFFWARTGGTDTAAVFDVFQWRSDTGTSTRLSSGGLRNVNPQSDETRVAWQQTPLDGRDDDFTLMAGPIGGAATPVGTNVSIYALRDGLLTWVERTNGGGKALRAATTHTTATLSNQSSVEFYGNAGGVVVYGEQQRTYSWSPATGSTLRVDARPSQALVADGSLFFLLGSTVYRAALH